MDSCAVVVQCNLTYRFKAFSTEFAGTRRCVVIMYEMDRVFEIVCEKTAVSSLCGVIA